MLRKKFKKVMSIILATATIMTVFTPVTAQAATPKPKYKHSKAEITERVDYFNENTAKFCFMPNGWYPAMDDIMVGSGDIKNGNAMYGYKMTQLLRYTPGISSKQKSDMYKAQKIFQKAYYSEVMLAAHWDAWTEVYNDCESKTVTRAKNAYNTVKKAVDRYQKYNPKLSSWITTQNRNRYNAWKAAYGVYSKMSPEERRKVLGGVASGGRPGEVHTPDLGEIIDYSSKLQKEFTKRKTCPNPSTASKSCPEYTMARAQGTYSWYDCGLHPFNTNKKTGIHVWWKMNNWKKW